MFRLMLSAAILVAILTIGWRQPLRYRFMSPAEIEALESPPSTATAAPARGTWMWHGKRTLLDR